ncbi:MAG: gamma-glutamylcyclotransferase [Burkholderiaceae bacterium]
MQADSNRRVPFDFPGRVTAEQQAASLQVALSAWDRASPLWLFGYGSLIWNPEVTYDRRMTARVHGYHRRLCLWSRVNRGTLECPGLVAGLDRGGSCAGVVYRLTAKTAAAELEQLWEREMFMGSYEPRWLECRLIDNSTVSALAFVVRREAQNYAGKLSEAEILAVFERGSCGRFGTSLDYLICTVNALREHGLRDPHFERLARHAGVDVPRSKMTR